MAFALKLNQTKPVQCSVTHTEHWIETSGWMRHLMPLTSSMTEQMCLTHWVMACGVPEMVTALSVESGSMSPATWTWAPVVLILPDIMRKQRLLSAERAQLKSSSNYPPNCPPKHTLTSSEQLQNRIAAYASIFEVCVHQFHSVQKGIFSLHNVYSHNQRHFYDQQAGKTHFSARLRKSLLVLLDTWSTGAPRKIFELLLDFLKK